MLTAHKLETEFRQPASHHAAVRRNCGGQIKSKRLGRKRQYCSDRCRDEARRQIEFDFAEEKPPNGIAPAGTLKKLGRYPPPPTKCKKFPRSFKRLQGRFCRSRVRH